MRGLGVDSGVGPSVWVVAGCLFEISLPAVHRFVHPSPEVTLLSEHRQRGHHHFRIRAETPGVVTVRFVGDAGECLVQVLVAPEHVAGP